jgi:signal peptidase I
MTEARTLKSALTLPVVAQRIYRWACGCFALFGLAVLIFSTCFNLEQMVSPSMTPTLRGTSADDGDWVFSERISYWFRNPKRWEVVRFRNADADLVMKRVGGLPGETVGVNDEGGLVINAVPLAPPKSLHFLHYYGFGPYLNGGKQVQCGPDHYFVLGDDSRDSLDSRYEGTISRDRVRGRAWLIVWPLSRVGWVNP